MLEQDPAEKDHHQDEIQQDQEGLKALFIHVGVDRKPCPVEGFR